MPSSDYASAVKGGLKLKGAKDAGVRKHKKKKTKPESSESKTVAAETEQDGEESSTLQKALAEEEGEDAFVGKEVRKVDKDAGKTEAQRKHEEIRRKRVRSCTHSSEAVSDIMEIILTGWHSSTTASSAKASRPTRSESRS